MLRVDSRVDSMPANNSLPANLETTSRVSTGHLEPTSRVSAGHLEPTSRVSAVYSEAGNRVSAGHLETTSRVSTGLLETTGVGRRSAQDHHLHSSHHHQQHPHARHLRPRPTSADVQPRCVRSTVAPPRLPAMSGVLQSSGPVIRPVAYRPTPNHTPSTTPTRLHGSEPPTSSSHRASHYASASDLKQSGASITPGNTRLTRGKFESMDNLKLPSEEQYISPSVLVDDYRGSRITSTPASVRSCEPRRESFTDFTDSPGRRVVRHDSLKGMWNSGGGGGGVAVLARSSMGGSVSNLTSHPGADRRGDMISGGYLHHHHPHHHQQRLGAQRSSSVTCDPRTSSSTGCSAAAGGPTGCSSSNYGSSLTIAGGERHDSAGSGTTDPPSFSSLVGLRLDPVGNSTPSPSDSGVAELEAILKERDSEINFLRETMEQNEQVIFKVYEEKEKTWEKELRKIKAIYDNRLKATQQRALKMEQMLTTQTYQLQQEKRKLRQELDETLQEKQQLSQQYAQMKRELAELRTQLEDTEWTLCQKTVADAVDKKEGEISLLKCQLKDSQGDRTTRGHEMLHIRAQVREYSAQLESKEAENRRLQAETSSLRQQTEELRTDETSVVIGQLQREIERLRGELSGTQSQLHDQKTDFEQERLHWLDEKQKVVSYQKQLQLNYMEMYKRNKSLETELLNRENKLNSSGESQC